MFSVTRIEGRGVPRRFLAIARVASDAQARAQAAARRWGLSPRQAQVLERVVLGESTARIGAELDISDRTVEAHVEAIFAKADVASRAQLMAEVLR